MNKKVSNGLLLLGLIVLGIFVAFSTLRWLFNNHTFRYGDLNYYLLTDKEFRQFPVIGAKSSTISYHSYIQDGNTSGVIVQSYYSSKSPTEATEAFQKTANQLGYSLSKSESKPPSLLVFTNSKNYEAIYVHILPHSKRGSDIYIEFIKKSNQNGG